jgi:hypothetical protein
MFRPCSVKSTFQLLCRKIESYVQSFTGIESHFVDSHFATSRIEGPWNLGRAGSRITWYLGIFQTKEYFVQW